MMKIVATILTKTLKTTDHPFVTIPHEDLQNTQESMIPNLPDVARESTADRGHMIPMSETTVVGEGGGTETVTEIVRVSVEAVNTRRKTRRRRKRSVVRVCVVGPGQAMKRTSLNRTSSLEKWAKLDLYVRLDQTKNHQSWKKERLFKIPLQATQPIRRLPGIIRISSLHSTSSNSSNIWGTINSTPVLDKCHTTVRRRPRAHTQTTCMGTPRTHTTSRQHGRLGNNSRLVSLFFSIVYHFTVEFLHFSAYNMLHRPFSGVVLYIPGII